MSVVITADSTCDLPKNIIEERNITITPLSILLGSESFLDGREITRDDIYDHVSKTGEMPKTAAVPPACDEDGCPTTNPAFKEASGAVGDAERTSEPGCEAGA